MPRNLDMTALRSFAAVADSGGVTRAAGLLHLTQSAVSMQLKRLEESLGRTLLDRAGRGVALTADGEQLLGYARRMLSLNDEIYERLTDHAYEGEIVLGVPLDVVYPAVPKVLRLLHADYPRMKINLVSSYTTVLHQMFARGDCDVIVTTENHLDAGGEELNELPLVWVGAPDGSAWKARPLGLGFEYKCFFRKGVQGALDKAGIPWFMAVESEAYRTIEATVSADLAIHAVIEGTETPQMEPINHGGALPELASVKINMYAADTFTGGFADALLARLRQAFSDI